MIEPSGRVLCQWPADHFSIYMIVHGAEQTQHAAGRSCPTPPKGSSMKTVTIRNNSGSLTMLGPVEGLIDDETGEALTPDQSKVSILPLSMADVPVALLKVHAHNPAFEARFKSGDLEFVKPGDDAPALTPADLNLNPAPVSSPEGSVLNAPAVS